MARPGKVPFWVKFSFGFGQVGESAFFGLILTFAALYYNQALRLENSLVGLAIAIAVIFDAISDPAIGVLSDRWKGKWGRRHPFLFIAPIPLALCAYFLFSPPEFLTAVKEGAELPAQMPLFAWMAVWHILARFFLTLYIVPHLALGAELSSDYEERASVFSYNAMFGFGFGNIFAFSAWSMLADTSVRAYDGATVPQQLDAANYPPVVLLACLFIILGIFICAFGTRREISHLAQAKDDQTPFSPWIVVMEMWETIKIRNYLMLLAALFFLWISLGFAEYLGPFIGTFFWEFEGGQLKMFNFAFMAGYILGAAATPFWVKKFGKRMTCIGTVGVYAIIMPIPVLDRTLGWNLITPGNESEMLLPFLLVHAFIHTFAMGGLNVAVMAMLADIIDQHALKTGHVQSAIFYSARTFFAKASQSFAVLVAGYAMTYIVKLPVGAVPSELADGVLTRMGWVHTVAFVGALIAIFFYAQYRLSKEDHARIREQLEAQQPVTPAFETE